jgi:hypothetical protein
MRELRLVVCRVKRTSAFLGTDYSDTCEDLAICVGQEGLTSRSWLKQFGGGTLDFRFLPRVCGEFD